MRLIRPAVLFATLLLAGRLPAADKEAFAGEGDKWRHFQSPHFELYSANAEKESREMLYHLELLRASFLGTFKLIERRPLDVTVYYFGSERDFTAYKPEAARQNENLAGFYVSHPDRAVVILGPRDDGSVARQMIFHEYVHHLIRIAEENPPTWYNEGMAELFSTIELKGDSVILGLPKTGSLRLLQQEALLPLETLFAVDPKSAIYREGTHTGVFYSESWALIHYFLFGQTKLPRERLDQFLGVAGQPASAADPARLREACRQLLELEYPELQKQLERYIQVARYQPAKFPVPKLEPQKSYVVRPVEREEIHARLAEVALRVNDSAAAWIALRAASAQNPADPHLHEVLGMAALVRRDEPAARDEWEKAIAVGSVNPAIFHELGQMESREWLRKIDYSFQLPEDVAEHLRFLLRASIKSAPEQSTAYETLIWVEAAVAKPSVENVNLVQKRFPTLKDKPRTLLALALVHARVNEKAPALAVLDTLDQMKPNPAVAYDAENLRARLEGRATRAIPPAGPSKWTFPIGQPSTVEVPAK